MKKMKKVLALVLSVSLVFTMAVPSVAGDGIGKTYNSDKTDTINYLAIGDGQVIGYGEDFTYVENSYPDIFANSLAGTDKKVNLYQYGMKGMTLADLLVLLGVNGSIDYVKISTILSDENNEDTSFGDKICIQDLIKFFGFIEEQNHDNFEGFLETADVITMDFGLNTVSSYLLAGLNGKRSDSASQQAIYDALFAAVMAKFADNTTIAGKLNSTENILGALVYAISAYTQDYIAAVTAIDKLNDVKGLKIYNIVSANAVTDLALQIKDDMLLKNITNPVLTGIVDTLFRAANSYIEKTCDKLGVDFTNVYPGDFETIGDKLKAATTESKEQILEEDDVSNFIDTVVSTIGLTLGLNDNFDNNNLKLIDMIETVSTGFNTGYNEKSGYKAIKDAIVAELSNKDATPLYLSNVAEMLKSKLESKETDKLAKGTAYEKIRAALLTEDAKSETEATAQAEIKDVFSKENATATPATADGVGYDFLKLCLNVVCAAGNVATIDDAANDKTSGHEAIAAALETAYTNSDAIDAQDVLKVAVPVIVGGVAVTLVTSAVVKAIKNKNSDQLSEDSELSYDAEAETEASSPLASFMAKIESVMKQATSIFTSFFTKLKTGNTYEFSYVAPSTK